MFQTPDQIAQQGRDALASPDTESSRSRQHYIDTGRYLTYGEVMDEERREAVARFDHEHGKVEQ
jgi:hypothetical protein